MLSSKGTRGIPWRVKNQASATAITWIVVLSFLAAGGATAGYFIYQANVVPEPSPGPEPEPPGPEPGPTEHRPDEPVLTFSVTGTTVTLSWDFQDFIDMYSIYHGTSPADLASATKITDAIGSDVSFVDSTSRVDGLNVYFIYAKNETGTTRSNVVEVTVAFPKPKAPSQPLVTVAVSGTTANVGWNSQDSIDTYSIFHSTSPDVSSAVKIAERDGTTTFFSDTINRVHGLNYYFVEASNVTGTTRSNVVEVNIAFPGPPSPTVSGFITGVSKWYTYIYWGAVSDVDTYEVFVSYTAGLSDAVKVTTLQKTATSYTTPFSLTKVGMNYWYIEAVNVYGRSRSNIASFNFAQPSGRPLCSVTLDKPYTIINDRFYLPSGYYGATFITITMMPEGTKFMKFYTSATQFTPGGALPADAETFTLGGDGVSISGGLRFAMKSTHRYIAVESFNPNIGWSSGVGLSAVIVP